MRWALALVLAAGCDGVFGLDRLPDSALPPEACTPEPNCVCDAFTGMVISNDWAQTETNRIQVSQDDALIIAVGAGAQAEGGLLYSPGLDLTGGSVSIEVPENVVAHPNAENYLRVRVGSDNRNGYVIRFGDDKIDFRTRVNNVYAIHSVRPFDPATDRFWRLENGPAANQVTFSTRGTAQDQWRIEVTQPAANAFDNVQVLLVAGGYQTGPATDSRAVFDNFEACRAP